jgi:hypothetical protein
MSEKFLQSGWCRLHHAASRRTGEKLIGEKVMGRCWGEWGPLPECNTFFSLLFFSSKQVLHVRAYIYFERTWLCRITPVILHGVVSPGPTPCCVHSRITDSRKTITFPWSTVLWPTLQSSWGQILSQSLTDVTSARCHLYRSWLKKPSICPWVASRAGWNCASDVDIRVQMLTFKSWY